MIQVERFACLYTSQVTNLGLYSPSKYYRPSEDFMPHEFDILEMWKKETVKVISLFVILLLEKCKGVKGYFLNPIQM